MEPISFILSKKLLTSVDAFNHAAVDGEPKFFSRHNLPQDYLPKKIRQCEGFKVTPFFCDDVNTKESKFNSSFFDLCILSTLDNVEQRLESLEDSNLTYEQKTSLVPLNHISILPEGVDHFFDGACRISGLTMISFENIPITIIPKSINILSNLREFVLVGCPIEVLPPEIGDLTNLTYFNMEGTHVSSFPEEFRNLTNLGIVRCQRNRITNFSQLCSLPNLIELALSDNMITEIHPEIIGLSTLWTLKLGGNQIQVIPPEIKALTSLCTLTLERNMIQNLPQEIVHLTNIYKLKLDHNQIKTITPSLATKLGGIKRLKKISIKQNPISISPPKKIIKIFEKNGCSAKWI